MDIDFVHETPATQVPMTSPSKNHKSLESLRITKRGFVFGCSRESHETPARNLASHESGSSTFTHANAVDGQVDASGRAGLRARRGEASTGEAAALGGAGRAAGPGKLPFTQADPRHLQI